MNKSILKKYKLETIDSMSSSQCEEASLILRYLLSRCFNPIESRQLEAYLYQLDTRLAELKRIASKEEA